MKGVRTNMQMNDDEIATLFAADEDDCPTKFLFPSIKRLRIARRPMKKLRSCCARNLSSTNGPDSTLATPNTHWSLTTARLSFRKYSRNLESNGTTNYLCTQAKHVLSSLWASTLPGAACAKPWKTYAANANHVSCRSPS
jgi:hypothetical protein